MITEKTVVMMLDTETTNDIECPICYDVGYQIFTLGDGVLCEKSFVNADIFLDKEMMENAYFADKIPQYWDEITEGKRQLRKWYNIRKELREDCQKYGVEIICAHNARFDYLSLHTTQRYITTSKYRWVLPYGIEWYDTLKMSREVLGNCDEYKSFCDAHGYRTKNGQLRMTAEIIYQFLTGNTDFVEAHTGLEDVKIEREIFKYCVSQNPEINGTLWSR